jgi:hypothetical protein
MLRRAAAVVAALLGSGPSRAAEPIDLIPAESLLCWYGRPFPDTAPLSEQPSTLQALLDLGAKLAGQPLDANMKILLRSAEMLNVWVRYPHALALIDTRARPADTNPEGKRVDQLRFVLVVNTGGQSEPFLRIIQTAVNEQTDTSAATLTRNFVGEYRYQKLRDQRLPDWCEIAWGQIDDNFVFTVGQDVWPTIAALADGGGPSLSHTPWNEKARAARGREALIEIFVAMKDIRQRLDPFVGGRATEFFRAWQAEEIDQAYWAFGFKSRAMFCEAHFRTADETVTRLYADPETREPRLLATIPDSARYAIYRVPMAKFFPQLVTSMLATRGRAELERIERTWTQIQSEQKIDAQRDLLDHLGEYAVLHNDPPHPLRLPLAMTTLTEVKSDPNLVRQTIDRACTGLRNAIQSAVAEGQSIPLNFHRDDDGVWSLQFGPIAGPAWTVTDRFVITSWSPTALRSYLEKIGNRSGTPLHGSN